MDGYLVDDHVAVGTAAMKLWLLLSLLCSDNACHRTVDPHPMVFVSLEECALFASIAARAAGPTISYQCQKAESI